LIIKLYMNRLIVLNCLAEKRKDLVIVSPMYKVKCR
jgi:hypothetical protein